MSGEAFPGVRSEVCKWRLSRVVSVFGDEWEFVFDVFFFFFSFFG